MENPPDPLQMGIRFDGGTVDAVAAELCVVMELEFESPALLFRLGTQTGLEGNSARDIPGIAGINAF
jgi:hypothetical protein